MITTQAIYLGSIMLPWGIMIVIFAILLSILLAKLVRTNFQVSMTQWTVFKDSIWTAVLLGLICGRIGFVALNLSSYIEHPIDIIKIQDKGFQIYIAIFTALAWVYWKNRNIAKKFIWLSITTFLLIFTIGHFSHHAIQMQFQQFPKVSLQTLEHEKIELTQFIGKPTVINLWASWCPPCRREMPILSEAQQMYPDVQFIFINQNEDAATVQNYLSTHKIHLNGIMLDHDGTVAQLTGMFGLPSTLFYNAQGQLIDSHMGEITHAVLVQKIKNLEIK